MALGFIEQGVLGIEEIVGLNSTQAYALLQETRFTQKRIASTERDLKDRLDYVEKEAKETTSPRERARMKREGELLKEKVEKIKELPRQVARQVSTKLKSKSVSAKIVRGTTDHILDGAGRIPAPLPSDREFIGELVSEIQRFLHPHLDKARREKLKAIVDNQTSITSQVIDRLIEALTRHVEICQEWIDKLETGKQGNHVKRSAAKALPVK